MPRLFKAMILVKLTCADVPALLSYLQACEINLYDISFIDELTVEFRVCKESGKRLFRLLDKKGIHYQCVGRTGIYWSVRALLRRPILIFALMFIFVAGTYLPTRIFFFEVEGNMNIPTRLILEAADECGVKFGAFRKDVRSEKMKNALLQKIPQLQWAGINTSGCVATISVKERQQTSPVEQNTGVTSLVATKDGIICDMTVIQGSPVCKIGQGVSSGQVLISGYMDCNQSIRATRAKGEIYAATGYKLSVATPANCEIRGDENTVEKKYSVIFGKKRINFYKDSGILDSSCVKMYEENYVTLPGGFRLPIAIVTETRITYHQSMITSTAEESAETLSEFAEKYLIEHMIAGRVCSQNEQFSAEDGVIVLSGEYGCIEMIAQERNEEILKP